MATDAALLAVGVKTEGATQATSELAKLADQAGKTEQATNKLSGSFDSSKTSTAAFGNNVNGVKSSLDNISGSVTLVTVGVVALAAAAAAVTFAKSVTEAIDFAASLQDMKEKTGASTTALQKIAPAADIAGVSFESVEQAITIMSKNMAGADDKSKGLGKALDTLGISARDSNGKMKDGATIYLEMATQLEKYEDGAGKTGLAMDAMGRSGADQLKVMAALKESLGLTVIATDAQVEASDRYNDNLVKLNIAGGAFAKIIGFEIAPVLADFTDALLDVATGSGGIRTEMDKLAKEGKIREWAQDAALWVANVIDVFDALVRVAQILWSAISTGVEQTMTMFTGLGDAMKLALQGKFGEAAEAAKDTFTKMKASGSQFVTDFDTIASKAQFSTLLKAKFAETDTASGKTKDASDKLGLAWKDADAEAKKYADSMDKLLKAISDGNDKLKLEGEALTQTRTERELANAKLEREKALRDDTLGLTVDQINKLFDERNEIILSNAARRDQKEAIENSVKAYIAEGEEIVKASKAQADRTTAIGKEIDALEKQIKTFGLTSDALRLYEIEERRQIALSEAVDDAERAVVNTLYDKEVQLANTITAQEKAAESTKAWQGVLDDANTVAGDFFQAMGDGMDGIKEWAQNAGDALKKFLLQVLYELTAKPFIVSIVTSLSGGALSGAANAATGGAGGGGILDSITSLFGGNGSNSLSGLSNLFGGGTLGVPGGALGTFATSSLGESLGLSVAMGAGEGSVLTGLGTAFTAALPWAAVAALAIPAIMSFLKRDPSQVEGTFRVAAGTEGFEDNAYTETAFGNIGFADEGTRYFSGEAAQSFNSIVKIALDAFAAAMTAEQISSVASKLQGTIFYMAKGNYTTEDFIKEYGGDVLKKTLGVVADELDTRLGDIVRNFQGTGEELALFATVLAGVYTMVQQLPEDVGNTLLDVMAAGVLTVEEIGRFAVAYVGLQNVMALDPVALALDGLSAANVTAYDKVLTLRGGLQDLLDSYDGSVAGTEALYGATMDYVQAQIIALGEIENMRVSLGDMFGEAHDTLEQFFWTNTQKADKLQADAANYQKLLNETLDPTLIQEYSTLIKNDLMKAFQLLSPEEQKAQQGSFLSRIDAADALAQSRLDASTAAITQKGDAQMSIMESIRDALNSAAQSMVDAAAAMKQAADDQGSAADVSLRAANTPVSVSVDVAPIQVDSYVYVDYGPQGG